MDVTDVADLLWAFAEGQRDGRIERAWIVERVERRGGSYYHVTFALCNTSRTMTYAERPAPAVLYADLAAPASPQ